MRYGPGSPRGRHSDSGNPSAVQNSSREPEGAVAWRRPILVAFRKHTQLPLDDCLYALQPTIPHLSRSLLHRCLSRHGISRLRQIEGDKEPKKKLRSYPLGCFHIDIAQAPHPADVVEQVIALRRQRLCGKQIAKGLELPCAVVSRVLRATLIRRTPCAATNATTLAR